MNNFDNAPDALFNTDVDGQPMSATELVVVDVTVRPSDGEVVFLGDNSGESDPRPLSLKKRAPATRPFFGPPWRRRMG